jgi:uncharacterized membrane protein YeaQ/YmgE (transglycosylase-associated protein family)
MSGTLINIIIQLIAGAIGAHVVGGAAKDVGAGPTGNTIAGVLGGVAGGSLLTSVISMLSGPTRARLDRGEGLRSRTR